MSCEHDRAILTNSVSQHRRKGTTVHTVYTPLKKVCAFFSLEKRCTVQDILFLRVKISSAPTKNGIYTLCTTKFTTQQILNLVLIWLKQQYVLYSNITIVTV
jgi:hypothetical protein